MTRLEFNQIPTGWRYLAPAITFLIALTIYLGDKNVSLFYALNHLSEYTGSYFWASLTMLGDGIVIIPLTLVFLRHKPDILITVFYSFFIVLILSHLLKASFDAIRPAGVLTAMDFNIIGPVLKKNSFPSGHTMTVFAWTSIIIFHLKGKTRRLWGAPLLILACLVALSRVAVGAHWPLDIAGGASAGWLCGLLSTWLSTLFNWHNKLMAKKIITGFFLFIAFVSLLFVDPSYPSVIIWHKALVLFALLFALLPIIKALPQRLKSKTDPEKEQGH